MDTLPPELFLQVLDYLPVSSSKSARLTSRRFNAALAHQTFDTLRAFIEPAVAQSTLFETVSAMPSRPFAIWSPRCNVPDDIPLSRSFLLAMYAALEGSSWCSAKQVAASAPEGHQRRPMVYADSSDDSSSDEDDAMSVDGFRASRRLDAGEEPGVDEEEITVETMLGRLSRRDVTEAMLRQAMFRYSLFQSYIYTGEGESPHLWIMHRDTWASKAAC
ncbi:hypothetical protein K4F52_000551 [Lecanicillium sp. MT-2017a]|nr:hypothetical protein K4F52_000551 [Lecanicillium sp. MT-2017a]